MLKSDRSATYQQIGVPDPGDADRVAAMRERQGEDVWPHHEFTRAGGEVQCADLPIIRYRGPDRLAALFGPVEDCEADDEALLDELTAFRTKPRLVGSHAWAVGEGLLGDCARCSAVARPGRASSHARSETPARSAGIQAG